MRIAVRGRPRRRSRCEPVVLEALAAAGHEPLDLGTSTDPDDYPDIALRSPPTRCSRPRRARGPRLRLGRRRRRRRLQAPGHPRGDGARHLHRGTRRSSTTTCNVLCLGARVIGPADAAEIIAAFARGDASRGEERHVRRLGKILAIEREFSAERADRGRPLMAVAGEHEGDYLPIAEHGLVGDLHTVALVGTNGTIDWYCCPAFDAPSVFGAILDKDHGGLLRDPPDRRRLDLQAALLPGHERPHHPLLHPRRRGRGPGLHADRGAAGHAPPPAAPARRRRARRDGVPDRGAAALRLRPRGARGRAAPARRAVPRAVALARARGSDRQDDGRRRARAAPRRAGRPRDTSRSHAGESQTFVLERVPAGPHLPPVLRARDRARRSRRPSQLLAPLARALALPRALARDGAPLRADPEAADLRADRRARRRADHVAARAARRRAQLGLPLHVDPRRGVLALRAAAARLHRGGGRVHGAG